MESKIAKYSERSVGGLLLAVAAALFIGSRAEVDFILPHDPLIGISIRYLFWIGGSAASVVALVVLVNNFRSAWPLMLSAWLAINFLVYQCGLLLAGRRWVDRLSGWLVPCLWPFGKDGKYVESGRGGVFTVGQSWHVALALAKPKQRKKLPKNILPRVCGSCEVFH